MPTGRQVATFERLASKKPVERKVTIYLDDDAVAAFDEARKALEKAQVGPRDSDTYKDAQTAYKAAEKALKAASVDCRFRAIGRRAYEDLQRQHPPTPEQLAEAKTAHDDAVTAWEAEPADRRGPRPFYTPPAYDAESFAPALISASCVEPAMTVEQVSQLFEEWNRAEVIELWMAALEVNQTRRVVQMRDFWNGTPS